MPVPLSRRTISTYGPGAVVRASSTAASPSGETTSADADLQRAAARHRLHGVEREVVEHLHDLALVGLDRAAGRPRNGSSTCTPVFCVARAHGPLRSAATSVERLAHGVAALGEGQELARQVARAPAGFLRAAQRVDGARGQFPARCAPRTGCPAWR